MAYRRGFKAEAEAHAIEVRAELDLNPRARLDVFALASYLEIPVWTLSSLPSREQAVDGLEAAIDLLFREEQDAVSAYTVFKGTARTIVYNDAHGEDRQASNISHEISHSLLLHPPSPVFDHRGCRRWNRDIEDEASYLSGALLVPKQAAWWLVKQKMTFQEAARYFGCSVEMIRYRVNITGASRLLAG